MPLAFLDLHAHVRWAVRLRLGPGGYRAAPAAAPKPVFDERIFRDGWKAAEILDADFPLTGKMAENSQSGFVRFCSFLSVPALKQHCFGLLCYCFGVKPRRFGACARHSSIVREKAVTHPPPLRRDQNQGQGFDAGGTGRTVRKWRAREDEPGNRYVVVFTSKFNPERG